MKAEKRAEAVIQPQIKKKIKMMLDDLSDDNCESQPIQPITKK